MISNAFEIAGKMVIYTAGACVCLILIAGTIYCMFDLYKKYKEGE